MENILKNPELKFHGVGHNLLKYSSILKHGIVTKNDSKGINGYSKNYSGYNQDNMVSLASSPSIHGTYTYGAFGTFIANGISFVLSETPGIKSSATNHDSKFVDEEFHFGSIDKSKIVGIMINESLINKKITELNILRGMGLNYVNSTCQNIISHINDDQVRKSSYDRISKLIDEREKIINNKFLNDYLIKSKLEDKIISKMNDEAVKNLETYFTEILQKDNISVIDVIDYYNVENLPIYNQEGNLLDYKKTEEKTL